MPLPRKGDWSSKTYKTRCRSIEWYIKFMYIPMLMEILYDKECPEEIKATTQVKVEWAKTLIQ